MYPFGRCTVTCIALQVHIYIWSTLAFPGKQTNDLGTASTVLYLSYKKVHSPDFFPSQTKYITFAHLMDFLIHLPQHCLFRHTEFHSHKCTLFLFCTDMHKSHFLKLLKCCIIINHKSVHATHIHTTWADSA